MTDIVTGQDLFDALDINSSQTLSRDEVILGLDKLHLPHDDENIDTLFAEADDDNDGMISRKEFISYAKERTHNLHLVRNIIITYS